MTATMATVLGVTFILNLLFVAWLKYDEHLDLHRDEYGAYSSRTDVGGQRFESRR